MQRGIGVKHRRIKQKARGFMGGSFNTHEFFHNATIEKLRLVRRSFVLLAFVLPILLIVTALATSAGVLLVVAFAVQSVGLLAECWHFFADANDPQNLQYKTIS